MAVLNIADLTRNIGPISQDLILKMLEEINIEQLFTVDGTVSDRKRFRFLKINPDLKPYDKSNPDTIADDKMIWGEDYVEVKPASDEYPFDPEDYRTKFEDYKVRTTMGEIPKYQETLAQIAKQILVDIIIGEVIWNGDTSLTTGSKHLRIIDGLKKQIATLKADANSGIHVVPTGALTAGSGWGAGANFGNVEDKMKLVAKGLPKAVQQAGFNIYISSTQFDRFEEDNRRKHGATNYFTDADGNRVIYLHGTKKKGLVVEAPFMPADSETILCTPKDNLIFAHDMDLDESLSKMTSESKIHDKVLVGFKFVFGVKLLDPDKTAVNERN